MAYWRNRTADRQAEAAHKQTETAERGLQSDRYQKGAEMLGGDVLAVRMGGILALERLALEQPAEYHIQIMDLLCAFILHPYEDANHHSGKPTTSGDIPRCRPDVELAVKVIGRRGEAQRKIEQENQWQVNLPNANLAYANLCDAKLQGANLIDANMTNAFILTANLSGALLIRANLTNASLCGVTLSYANLQCANLNGANLGGTDLTGAILGDVRGLTQEQLNTAIARKKTLPNLTNAFHTEIGVPLIWAGETIAG